MLHFGKNGMKNNYVKQMTARIFISLTLLTAYGSVYADGLSDYNIQWSSQSKNSGESMPCGGGDIGLNVWVENGDILFYMSRSGAFDESNLFPKFGRIRMRLTPNPFMEGAPFSQELKLQEGYVHIKGKDTDVEVWVDIFNPAIHVQSHSKQPVKCDVYYENWRLQDRRWTNPREIYASRGYENTPEEFFPVTYKDQVSMESDQVLFYHRNRNENTIFDMTVFQQKLENVKDQLFNPLKNMIFGGLMEGDNMVSTNTSEGSYADIPYKAWQLTSKKAARNHHVRIYLHIENTPTTDEWMKGLKNIQANVKKVEKESRKKNIQWWKSFWERSYIEINPGRKDPNSKPWQVGRNYQVFRYQLACNAYGKYPTKFNGGMFTYDPVFVDNGYAGIAPDHRNWGGGTFTAQNQRLVYWPMLKNGDFDMMNSQFDFYNRLLETGKIRSRIYFDHNGLCLGEQLEQFGLTCAGDYQWHHAPEYREGLDGNPWLENEWDTQMEFSFMMLEYHRFSGKDISQYMDFIENSLEFFFEHYLQEGRRNSVIPLDADGKLIIFPGSALETYKMTLNSSCTVAGLRATVQALLDLDDTYLSKEKREHWKKRLAMVPDIPFRTIDGHKTISPAVYWSRIQNVEIPQLYPVYPYGLYGIGKPDLDIAVNTWKYGVDTPQQKDYISWHQDAIFCARMGLTNEAKELTLKKMADSGRRFPTWWGPGHDWTPDHNWGGSGLIGVQEMLMQTTGKKIYLFPAWPTEWDVRFKLHAPYNTTITGELKDGKLTLLEITPEERKGDVEILLK